jgi:ElaB/YqjD/DUF883 family membrane-anchored ribosome-binding protein
MLTRHPSTALQKRDLHIGGLGMAGTGALAAITHPIRDVDSWRLRAREFAQQGDEFLRENPWAALATVAALGVIAGYLLSRRG